MMRATYGDGGLSQMTLSQKATCISRALGRALAHEIGHYLLASKDHAPKGLMKARHFTGDLFGPNIGAFDLTATQRDAVVAHLADVRAFARR
jgi:hypothetical protein